VRAAIDFLDLNNEYRLTNADLRSKKSKIINR